MALTRRLMLAGLAVATTPGAMLPGTALAGTLPAPAERPILTVSGRINTFNAGTEAQFDRAMLEALGLAAFTVRTPWYDRPVSFEGVLMTRLMQAVGAEGDTVTITALNDYETAIPVADFVRFGVLLALKRDGMYMPVSDKGPLFIVYPFDSELILRSQKYYSRSVWQVSHLHFT